MDPEMDEMDDMEGMDPEADENQMDDDDEDGDGDDKNEFARKQFVARPYQSDTLEEVSKQVADFTVQNAR